MNKNTIPFETRSPFVTSGIRIGTPAVTSRGLKTAEAKTVAGLITRILKSPGDETLLDNCRGQVAELCRSFPLYTAGDK